MPKKVLFTIHSLKLTYPLKAGNYFRGFSSSKLWDMWSISEDSFGGSSLEGPSAIFSVLAWWKNSMVVEWFFLVISNALQVADCTGSVPTCTETKQDRSTILSLHHPVRLEDTLHSLKARRKWNHSKWAKHKETAQIYCKWLHDMSCYPVLGRAYRLENI